MIEKRPISGGGNVLTVVSRKYSEVCHGNLLDMTLIFSGPAWTWIPRAGFQLPGSMGFEAPMIQRS
jgi:hypothetical protein